MTSSTSPGLAAMSMLDSVRSAMRGRLQRLAFEQVLERVHRPLPPQRVPQRHVTRSAGSADTADVVVDDRPVPERLDPDLHLADDLAGDRPAHALDAPVAGDGAIEVRPHLPRPRLVVEPGPDHGWC